MGEVPRKEVKKKGGFNRLWGKKGQIKGDLTPFGKKRGKREKGNLDRIRGEGFPKKITAPKKEIGYALSGGEKKGKTSDK